jgi:hypothetical protein
MPMACMLNVHKFVPEQYLYLVSQLNLSCFFFNEMTACSIRFNFLLKTRQQAPAPSPQQLKPPSSVFSCVSFRLNVGTCFKSWQSWWYEAIIIFRSAETCFKSWQSWWYEAIVIFRSTRTEQQTYKTNH